MTELILALLGTALVNNVVLTQFLGLCPFVGSSRQMDTAVGLGLATTFVLTLAAGSAQLLTRWLLVPLDAPWLRTIAFIVAIAAAVQLTALLIRRLSPVLHRAMGIFLPLITTNCAVLGVALQVQQRDLDFAGALLHGFGSALGFAGVLVLFTALRERIALSDVPAPFVGAPIALITAGVMALAFMGFAGMGSH